MGRGWIHYFGNQQYWHGVKDHGAMEEYLMATSSFAMLTVLLSCVIGAFGALFLKKGSMKLSLHKIINPSLLLGIFCYAIGLFMGIIALRFGDLSVLYPLSSTTYIWVTLLSKYQLKERINFFKILGISSIIFGVSLIGISR